MSSKGRKRTNTHNVVILGIQSLEQTRGTPPTSENDEGLLRFVERKLGAWVLVLLGVVIKHTSRSDNGDQSDPTNVLEERAITALLLAIPVTVATCRRGCRRVCERRVRR